MVIIPIMLTSFHKLVTHNIIFENVNMMILAQDKPPPGKSQWPSSSSRGSSSSTSGKTSGKQAQSFEYGDFKYMSILSVGENKKVLGCEFHGKPIVLKCTDLSNKPNCLDELLNEVEMYRVLAKLQGVYIPELLFYGDLANGMSFEYCWHHTVSS